MSIKCSIGNQVAAKVVQTKKYNNVLMSEQHASFLRHSNIVKILMIEQGASISLITMELCGTSLQDRLDKSALTKNDRVRTLRGITYALQFCHNAGIVHADVKPKNILMSADGQPKLTDFGSSVLIGESNDTFESNVRLFYLVTLLFVKDNFCLGYTRLYSSRGIKRE